MDTYKLAVDDYESANILMQAKKYRTAVYMYCLAIEKFLKAKISYVEHPVEIEANHDVINLLKCLNKDYPFKGDFKYMRTVRKYFNESRYPYSPGDADNINYEKGESLLSQFD